MSETFVVVGGGIAAGKAVEELRDKGFEGQVIVYTAEAHLPYQRPPLSKEYLLGKQELETVFVHPAEWYDEHQVQVRIGDPVTRIDPGAHLVFSAAGSIRYDRLLLATGAGPRRLPFHPGGARIAVLRTIEDSRHLKDQLSPGRRVTIIGGGWIGLEVAAAARDAGAEVTIILRDALPLQAVLGPEVAAVFAILHRKHGVTFHTEVEAVGIRSEEHGTAVRLSDGTEVEADLIVAAVGAEPDVRLAETAGLDVENGVLVDATLATSDRDIFAAGDVANAVHPLLERRIRVEHWDNAIGQGRIAADNMLGYGKPYERLPYFFTDQYDLGMEYVGHIGNQGYEQVIIRGEPDTLKFTAWWISGRRVLAGMHVNEWDAIKDIRSIVGTEVALAALRDPDVPLAELVAGA